MPEVYAGGSATFDETKAGYGYEWMNAASQFNDLLQEFLPTFEELGDIFGFLPQESQLQTIEVQPVPRPWYEDLPPWVWGVGAAVGAVLLLKLLED